CARSGVYFDYW
nr:immunoglobulin heavy chain junction region [Mus musculus]NSM05502.1 immunoglobulin heavy chain junction region [Mus musculus]NSM06430.1 immunoglobulin heavy chain junction region [Mus musculus]